MLAPSARKAEPEEAQCLDLQWHIALKRDLTERGFLEISRRWTEETHVRIKRIRLAEGSHSVACAAAAMWDAASAFGATALAEAATRLQHEAMRKLDCASAIHDVETAHVAALLQLEQICTGALWDVLPPRWTP